MKTNFNNTFRNLLATTALVLPSTGDALAESQEPPVKPAVVSSNVEAGTDEADRSELENYHKSPLKPLKKVSDERVLLDNGRSPNQLGGAIRIQERQEDRLSRNLNYINSQLQEEKVANLSQLSELIVKTMPNLLKPNSKNDNRPKYIVARFTKTIDENLNLPGFPDFNQYINNLDNREFEIAKHSINALAIAQNFDTALEDLAATTGFKPETIKQDGPLTLRLQDTVNKIKKYYAPHLYPNTNTPDDSLIPYNPYTVTDTNKGTNLENPYAGIMYEFNRLALFLGQSPIEMQAFENAIKKVQPYPNGDTLQSRSIEKVLPFAIKVIEAFEEKSEINKKALNAKEDDLNIIEHAINDLIKSKEITTSQIEELKKAFEEVKKTPLSAYLDQEKSKATEEPVKAPEAPVEVPELPIPSIPNLPSEKLDGPKLIIPNSQNNENEKEKEKPSIPDLTQPVA